MKPKLGCGRCPYGHIELEVKPYQLGECQGYLTKDSQTGQVTAEFKAKNKITNAFSKTPKNNIT